MRWDEAPVVEAPKKESWQAAPVAQPRSVLGEVGRQVGLTGRAALTGAAAIPAMGADALGYILNLGIKAYNSQTGSQIPEFTGQMDKLEQNLSAIGLPTPETGTERVVYGVNQALANQGAVVGAGRAVGGPVGEALSVRPDVQLQAAAGGAGAAGLTREAGFGPGTQLAAGVVGGVATPAAISMARGVPALVEPFTAKGQRNIAGKVLNESATAPGQSAALMSKVDEIVPGSSPTMAAASKDPGLASLERSLVAKPAGSTISDRYMQNNAARMDELNSMAGNQQAIDAAVSARDAATTGARNAALQSARVGSPSSLVVQAIDKTIKSPVGKRENVAAALNWAKQRLSGVTDPAELYAVRQDIGEAMGGKLAGDKASFKLASGELRDIQRMLDDVIEADAPGFKAYLQQYKDASKPINQMEIMQAIRDRSIGTAEDTLGNRQLLPSGFQRSMDDLDAVAAKATGFKKAQADQILTAAQKQRLEALRQDLVGEAFAKGGGKVSGSNTVQLANYSTANLIGRIVSGRGDSGPVLRNVARGLDWINKYNDQDIDRLLIEAAKNPALASLLMQRATARNVGDASRELQNIARSIGLATATSQATPKDK